MRNIEVSVVIPVYNSAAWLDQLVIDCHSVLTELLGQASFEIILVNDCSPNQNVKPCLEQLTQAFPELRAFNLGLNSGQFKATIFGLNKAVGRIVVTMDDDYQHSPKDIPKLLKAFDESPRAKCAIARFQEKTHSFGRRIGSVMFRHILRLAGKGLPRDFRSSSFRALRRELVVGICKYQSKNPLLGPMILSLTNDIVNVDLVHGERISGKSGYNLGKLISGFISGYLSMSTAPLRFTFLVGLGSSMVSAGMSTWYLARFFIYGVSVPGYTSQILATAFFGGITTFSIAIIGEYMSFLIREVAGPGGVVTLEEEEK